VGARSGRRRICRYSPLHVHIPDAARYACYDALETKIRQAQQKQRESTVSSVVEEAATAAEDGTADPVPVMTPPSRSPAPENLEHEKEAENEIADFGRTTPSTAGSARLEENGEGAQVLYDKVLSLREREPGRWLITLESGQVWYQTNSQRFRLREGMEVRIYPSPLGGSWRLSISGINGFIQVRRVE